MGQVSVVYGCFLIRLQYDLHYLVWIFEYSNIRRSIKDALYIDSLYYLHDRRSIKQCLVFCAFKIIQRKMRIYAIEAEIKVYPLILVSFGPLTLKQGKHFVFS